MTTNTRKANKGVSKKEKVVLAYVHVASKILPDFTSIRRCLNGSRIALDVLAEFGIAAEAISVRAEFMNKTWYDQMIQHEGWPKSKEEGDRWVAAGGYCIGVSTKPGNADDYPGHVIVVAPDLRLLVDSATSQFSRPERGITLPEIVAIPLPDSMNVQTFMRGEEPAIFENDEGATMCYTARPDDKEFWKGGGFLPSADNNTIKSLIVGYMRKILDK